MILKRIAQHQGIVGIEKQRNFLNHALTFQRLHEEWTSTKNCLLYQFWKLDDCFPFFHMNHKCLEMESQLVLLSGANHMGSFYCFLWKLNDCVANYGRGFPVIFYFYHVTLFFCCCLRRLPTMNKVLYYKVMHKYLFLREKRATEALGN